MPSLSHCLKKLKVSQAEAELVKGYAKTYRDEGYAGKEANRLAVVDIIKDLDDEYGNIVAQLEKIAGKGIA